MIQIVSFAIISAILITYLKNVAPEISLMATITAGIILLLMVVGELAQAFNLIDKIVSLTGISQSFYKIILKVTAIGYLTEFGANIVEDFGLKSLSNKLVFSGKVIILCVSMPIIYAMIELVINLVG